MTSSGLETSVGVEVGEVVPVGRPRGGVTVIVQETRIGIVDRRGVHLFENAEGDLFAVRRPRDLVDLTDGLRHHLHRARPPLDDVDVPVVGEREALPVGRPIDVVDVNRLLVDELRLSP